MGKKRFEKAQLKRKMRDWKEKFEEEHRWRLFWQERLKDALDNLDKLSGHQLAVLDIARKTFKKALKWEFAFWISILLWSVLFIVVLACQGQ